ncbi:membrane protein [Lysinibacillus sp. PLM2]|nr:membrane protein [Lysinibacillus sp. PLM2]
MPNNQTKALAHGVMMIALFGVIMMIILYVPLLSLIVSVIAPLPIAWYSANYNLKMSILVALLACVVAFIFGGLLIIPAAVHAAIGLVIGISIQLKKSKLFLLMSSGFTILLATAVLYIISLQVFGIDIIRYSLQFSRDSYDSYLELTKTLTGQTPPVKMEDLELMFVMIESTVPATVTLGAFGYALLIISANLPILKRLKVEVPKFSAFKDLQMPKSILWYYLIVLTINLFVRPEIGTTLYVIILNFSMILWVLLTIQGLSFIHYFLDKKFNVSTFVKVLVTIMAMPIYSFVILIGIFDLGFNIRSLVKDKIQK